MSQPIIGLAGQFNGFTAGAHERMLIANLQRAEIGTLLGATATVALGVLAYVINRTIQGKEIDWEGPELIKEGIARSGFLGWFEYANKLSAKASGGKADLFRLIGAEKPVTRYESQDLLATMLGPTAANVQNLSRITRALGTMEVSEGDVTAARRLFLPMQNHFLLGRLYDQVDEAAKAHLAQ
jgi:hypothetical protein